MRIIETTKPVTVSYPVFSEPIETWGPTISERTVTLGVDNVWGIVLNVHNKLVEWFTDTTPRETVQNFVTDGETFIHLPADQCFGLLPAARQELALHADCYGLTLVEGTL